MTQGTATPNAALAADAAKPACGPVAACRSAPEVPQATAAQCARWQPWLERAARISLRGHGNVEPNPMVGCVIVADAGPHAAPQFIAEGYHRKCGGAHAEVEALRRAGTRARGATAVVTLEPCNHQGRTGPCSTALRDAGIAQVVFACRDPHAVAAGGANALLASGVRVLHAPCAAAESALEPYLHTQRTGLPWVAAKWAQTLSGSLTARPGGDRWISGERSRAMVHRERGRVDAILTGIGTVLADDPLLTVRGTRARRTPLRVVWDPQLDIPQGSQLVKTTHVAPLLVATSHQMAETPRADALRGAGATVMGVSTLRVLLESLNGDRGVSTVMVEAGPGLLGALMRDGLVNEAWVFVAPSATSPASHMSPASPASLIPQSVRLRGRDVLIHYRLGQ